MTQNGAKHVLSNKKRRVAEMLADPEFKGTITELCEICGVPRRTFYHWRDDPEFCGYVDSLIDKYTESELAAVWKALIRSCLAGNVQAMRLYFELKNKFKQNAIVNAKSVTDDPLTKSLIEEAERLNNGSIT